MNNPSHTLRQIVCVTDTPGERMVRATVEATASRHRFTKFIEIALHLEPSHPACFAARLVAFDGVKPSAITDVGSKEFIFYMDDSLVVLEWQTKHGRCERRILSPMTSTALPPLRSNVWGQDQKLKAMILLEELLKYVKTNQYSDSITQLEADAIAWWHALLPAVEFGHVSGLQPLSAISCLARTRRNEFQLVQGSSQPNKSENDELLEGIADSFADDFARLETRTENRNQVARIRRCLDVKPAESSSTTKRRWQAQLAAQQSEILASGLASSLILHWVLNMIEDGTLRAQSPAASTIRTYFGVAADALHEVLASAGQSDDDEFSAVLWIGYARILENAPPHRRDGVVTALQNFQNFMHRAHGVPWQKGLTQEKYIHRVDANVVWPHEVARALTWAEYVPDPRLRQMVNLALRLAVNVPMRWSEAALLRLDNLRPHGVGLEVNVIRSRKFGRFKTDASQRYLLIEDRQLATDLLNWRDSRRCEGARSGDLLFGDPHAERFVYRENAFRGTVNALLRAATGDPSVSFHALRHTYVSEIGKSFLQKAPAPSEENRWRHLAVRVGHASPTTTVESYFHFYEESLAEHLAAGVEKVMSIGVTKCSAPPAASYASLQSSHALFSWTAPVAPRLVQWPSAPVTTATIKWVLQLLVAGHSIHRVEHLHGFEPGTVARLSAAAIDTLDEIARLSFVRRCSGPRPVHLDLRTALARAGIDLKRADQKKWGLLAASFKRNRGIEEAKRIGSAWLSCRKGNFLSVESTVSTFGLLKVLRDAGMPASSIRFCMPNTSTEVALQLIGRARTDFEALFGVRPTTAPAKPRLGRPLGYLQVDSDCKSGRRGVAGGSVAGLDAWMAVLLISAHWLKPGKDRTDV